MYQFNNEVTQADYVAFLDKIAPRFVEIEKFCDTLPEDNVGRLKEMLYQYAHFTNFLSFQYRNAVKFYKKALAQEWDKEGEFKGMEERKVRSRVEARCIEPDALLQHFDKLIKGMATSLTAIQSALSAEKSLMSNRENQ